MDYIDFSNFLNERVRERGFNLRRLSELSGIPLKHLENLAHGRPEMLPPAPYVRGYLLKLGQILEFDSQSWWENLQKEKIIKSSGQEDRLPENRYAKTPLRWYVFLPIIIFIVLVYLAYNFYRLSGKPRITILAPSQNPAVIQQNSLTLIGKIVNGDQLSINGEDVPFDKSGYFQKAIALQPGMNTIEINAKKFLGSETEAIRQIIYEPASSTVPNSSSSNL